MKDLWMEFAARHHQVRAGGDLVKSILERSDGLRWLKAMGTLTKNCMEASVYGEFYLPWYAATPLGDGRWWNADSRQLRVRDWAESYANGIEVPEQTAVERQMKVGHIADGPLCVASNGQHSVILDGAHRACVAYQDNRPMPCLVFESAFAPMLYALDFLHLVVEMD